MIRTIRRPAGRPAVRSRMPLQREIISAGASYLVYPSPSRSFPLPLLLPLLSSFSLFLSSGGDANSPCLSLTSSLLTLLYAELSCRFLSSLFSPVSFLLLLTRLYQFRTRLDNVRAKYVRARPPATTTMSSLYSAGPYLLIREAFARGAFTAKCDRPIFGPTRRSVS